MHSLILLSLFGILNVASLSLSRAAAPRTLQGADACQPTVDQPHIFRGIIALQSHPIGRDFRTNNSAVTRLYAGPNTLQTIPTLTFYKSLSDLQPDNYHFEKVIATPCAIVAGATKLQDPSLGPFPWDSVESGILRRQSNHSQCLKAINYDLSHYYADDPDFSYTGEFNETEAYFEYVPCPKTDKHILNGDFLWGWAYNSSIEGKTLNVHPRRPLGSIALTYSGTDFHAFSQHGGIHPDQTGYQATTVALTSYNGPQPFYRWTFLQLVGAYNGNVAKTKAYIDKRILTLNWFYGEDPYKWYHRILH
ncbi:hypothetical protein OC846_002989 [Tilletia horrida]|uniref:Uncharacterized protein n=1 Tax=Tilletia horrida TaxID=155126 RepID=A0AAN6GSR0_9BASI|nr:hypothetical protein OC846_002989 [Tilletia horrida]